MLWNAVIFGPADTPFEDGTFKLVMTFEESYPNKPPHVKFLSRMFHPNVYGTGELCLDILQNRWSPTYDVSAILTSIQSLLHDPNPNRYVTHLIRLVLLTRISSSVLWFTGFIDMTPIQSSKCRSCRSL